MWYSERNKKQKQMGKKSLIAVLFALTLVITATFSVNASILQGNIYLKTASQSIEVEQFDNIRFKLLTKGGKRVGLPNGWSIDIISSEKGGSKLIASSIDGNGLMTIKNNKNFYYLPESLETGAYTVLLIDEKGNSVGAPNRIRAL